MFYPNLHLQIPKRDFHYTLPALITSTKAAAIVKRSPSPSIPNLIQKTENVQISALSAGSSTAQSDPGDTNTSTDPDEPVPSTSEYLRKMTDSSANPVICTQNSTTISNTNWKSGKLTSKRLDQFAQIVLPSNVQIQLAQPFGKDSPNQFFYAQKCFRHVLLPVLKSGLLSCRATKSLEKASRRARQLQMLRKKYANVNFLPLQGFQADWEATTTIRDDWKAMTSACLLHFDGDVATMVRWIGGPHVNAHLDIPSILEKLRLIVDPDIHADVSRILLLGAPAECKAFASEENFQAFLKYGNHDSVTNNQDVYASTIVKQSKRGLTLIMDPKLIHFALNAHLSPQGLVDVLHPRRKPRPLSDSSFRPWPGAMAINDWTNKKNEPKLYFASSFMNFCKWQWNLAITYPTHDRHTGDDDVQCAFPRLKYNPQLVAMHSSISNGTLSMNTGLTFGDNTSPSNWEPIARARQQLAQHYWRHEPKTVMEKAKPFLPIFKFAKPATDEERAAFAVAIPDSINTGVIDNDGNRKPPTYDHHVDDNMYGDITELMPLAAAASVIALYDILGYPDGRIPDPISWDKFESVHGHIRRVVGWDFNTRDLTFALPTDKRQAITSTLREWCTKKSCTLVEAAEFHGTLADASRANRKGRTMFFGFQNALRRTIQQRYHQVRGYYSRQSKRQHMSDQLPKHLHHRLDSLIARDVATLIWKTKTFISISDAVAFEIRSMYAIMADPNRPWSISIGHVIPRDAQFTSLGDACGIGGGAYCHELEYWFDIVWSDHTRNQFDSGAIHINILEFIVVLLQLAAAITRSEEKFHFEGKQIRPLHKLLIRSDNSPSCNWAHKVSAKSERGQLLVSIYADLIERTQLTIDCTHIAGVDNDLADYLSRPPPELITHATRCQQIYQKEPRLRSYHFFRPSPELLSCLVSRLSTAHWQASPLLPKSLGRFETVDSITSSSVTI